MTDEGGLRALLDYLREERGFDFTGYKQPSLERRIARRLGATGAASHAEYVDYLQVHPEEFAHLFNSVLINVTSFFRDADTWDFLGQEIVPAILRGRVPPRRSGCGAPAARRARSPRRSRCSS